MSGPVRPRVIGVASGVGGGKSTLTQGLAGALGEASVLHFDHYERMTSQPIEAVRRWLEAGADPNALAIPGLAEDLAALTSGRPVADPATGAPIAPRRHLILETQFGREHAATGRYIDFLIWIDTPLDVALARKLRQFAAEVEAADAAAFVAWMRRYLEDYLGLVAALLRRQRETVRARADLVLDGMRDPQALRDEALREIRRRLP